MTAASGARFNLSDLNAGTTAISNLGFGINDKVAFFRLGEEGIVFKIPI